MTDGYLVYVRNESKEEMTFRFKDLHDAVSLYYASKHDETVTLVTVDGFECDYKDTDVFVGSENIRYYEKGVDYVRD